MWFGDVASPFTSRLSKLVYTEWSCFLKKWKFLKDFFSTFRSQLLLYDAKKGEKHGVAVYDAKWFPLFWPCANQVAKEIRLKRNEIHNFAVGFDFQWKKGRTNGKEVKSGDKLIACISILPSSSSHSYPSYGWCNSVCHVIQPIFLLNKKGPLFFEFPPLTNTRNIQKVNNKHSDSQWFQGEVRHEFFRLISNEIIYDL